MKHCLPLTELHESAPVGGEDYSHPVERVRGLGGLDAVDGNLAAHEEDEERDNRPQHLLPERNLFTSNNKQKHNNKKRSRQDSGFGSCKTTAP